MPIDFQKRVILPELMDDAPLDQGRRVLSDLTRINRFLGGHAAILRTLARAAKPDDRFSLLDIGAASGDTARVIRTRYPHASVTSLDYRRVNLKAAPHPKILADAFQLPFLPESFDYVLCSLFLHHFDDGRIVELLRIFYHVARNALFVLDLERHFLPYLFLPASKPIFGWHRITVYDGKISIGAAFRPPELLNLAERAGIRNAKVYSYRPAFRLALVARR